MSSGMKPFFGINQLGHFSQAAKARQVTLAPCVDRDTRVANIKHAKALGLPELKNLSDLIEPHGRTMTLACYGPSLVDTWPLLNEVGGDLFTVSGAHDFLRDRSFVPRGHIECDPKPSKATMLKRPHVDTSYFLASCCAPEMFSAVNCFDAVLWHSGQSVDEDKEFGSELIVIGGTTVASRAKSLGTVLGYRSFNVFGMDCSFTDRQHAGDHPNPAADTWKVKVSGREFTTSPQMWSAAQEFLWQVAQTKDCTYTLYGDGLLQHAVENMKIPRVRVVRDALIKVAA